VNSKRRRSDYEVWSEHRNPGHIAAMRQFMQQMRGRPHQRPSLIRAAIRTDVQGGGRAGSGAVRLFCSEGHFRLREERKEPTIKVNAKAGPVC